MDVVLHRIEALPGVGRYAVTFRRSDGSEQTAVVLASEDDEVAVAEASLPVGWTRESDPFQATAHAVIAVDHARRSAPGGSALRDVDGGWDVGLGNVEMGADGKPICTAHGTMADNGAVWVCADCGARAILD